MKTKDIKNKIKEFFFINPTKKIRVRQLERELKLPLPSIIRYLKELKEGYIIKSEEITNIIVFSADRTSKQFLLEKTLFNIKQLHESKLINKFIEEFNNPPIILFGSYSKGEDVEDSDIDIYIESPRKLKDLRFFDKKFNKEIQLFIYKKMQDIENKNLANNIINGIKLNGYVEVFK